MRKAGSLLVVAAILVAAGASKAGAADDRSAAPLRLFDLGPEGAPVWPGAYQVTEKSVYTPARGFGWRSTANLKAVKRPIPDDLGGDFVQGPGVFVVDVPEGDFRVWVLLCDSGQGINVPRFWVEPYYIKANGRQVISVDQGPETFFSEYWYRNWDVDWAPGQSLFEKYFAKYDRPHIFPASAVNGRIEIQFSYWCPVAAIAVWPDGDDAAARARLAAIRVARREQFDRAWKRAPLPPGLVPATYSSQDRQRGYVAWVRACGDPVFPYTEPQPYERKQRLELLACLDEYEPASICVRALQALKDVSVTLSPLRGPHGAILGGHNVQISRVKYVEVGTGGGRYEIRPRELLPCTPISLAENVTRQFWITVHVPADAVPGVYRGQVIVKPANRPATRLPLKLTVLPVRLASPGMMTGMYYYMPQSTDYRPFPEARMSDEVSDLMRKQLVDMRDHGMTTVAADPPWFLIRPDGDKLVYNEAAWQMLDRFYRAYKQAGFTAPLPAYSLGFILMMTLPDWPALEGDNPWQKGQAFDATFCQLYSQSVKMFYERVRQHRQAGEWPEVIFYASDELSNYGTRGGQWGVRHLKLLQQIKKQVPEGFTICCSMNGPSEWPMVPYLDIAIVNNGFPINTRSMDHISNSSAQLWFYNIGMHRFTWGYYPLKCEAKGRLQWHYHTNPRGTCDPYNWLTSSHYGVSMGPDGPLTNVAWEMVREGIDDARLVNTLRRLIEQARREGSAGRACDKAQADLKWIFDSINPDLSYYAIEAGYWDSKVFDKLKSMLAYDCVAILKETQRGR